MEVYTTKDMTVSKYVHDDGSETSIKTIGSCNNVLNPLTGKTEELEDRNKYVVFVSSSVGCKVGCKFCYLTAKSYPYAKLTIDEIVGNLKEAIISKMIESPELKKKYVKISFMGMGDALFNLDKTYMVAWEILAWIHKKGFAAGVDGIDIGTVLPSKTKPQFFRDVLSYLETLVGVYERNPQSNSSSGVRLFYSLHSFNSIVREYLIPGTRDQEILFSIKYLRELFEENPEDLIFHQMFLDGINDTEMQIETFVKTYRNTLNDHELRILKFNPCKNSIFRPSNEQREKEILTLLNEHVNNIKVQHSAGSEIKASCGQFIMKTFK